MIKRHALLGVAAATLIALLPTTPALAHGHGFRPFHPFGLGHGLIGAAVALATLPLVVASSVVAGVSESVAAPATGYAAPAYGYAPPIAYPQPYYTPYAGYYAAPRIAYGPRGYYAPRAAYGGRGYYRGGGNSYPRR